MSPRFLVVEPVGVVSSADEETGRGVGSGTVELEQRRSGPSDKFGQHLVDGPHLTVESFDPSGQITDHQIGRIDDRVRTLVGPHVCCLCDGGVEYFV